MPKFGGIIQRQQASGDLLDRSPSKAKNQASFEELIIPGRGPDQLRNIIVSCRDVCMFLVTIVLAVN